MAIPEPPATDGSSPQQRKFDQEPPMVIDAGKRYTATMVTSHGTMVIALDPLAAPKTVNSFVFLARYHYYDGVIFHRIIPGFVLQGGDPTGTGTGGPGTNSRTSCRRRAATRWDRWPWPMPAPTPTGASSSSSAEPTACGCHRSTPSSAPWSAGRDVVTTIDALGTRSGKPSEEVAIESVTIAEED